MVKPPFLLDIPSEGTPKCQESWELHDAVEVGGADLEERGDVAAFDQDPSSGLDHGILMSVALQMACH